MSSARLRGTGRTAVLVGALRNPRLRRVALAYFAFNLAEWANWIALLVWAYGESGVRGASAIALVQLVPAALLASPAAAWCERTDRARALFVGYLLQGLGYVAVGVALFVDAPWVVVGAAAAAAAVALTLTRPVHHGLLPEIADTTAELTAGNTVSAWTEAVANLAGPLLSAGVLVLLGPGGVLVTTGTLSLLGALLVLGLRPAAAPAETHDVARVGAGTRMRAVLGDPASRVLGALVAAEYVLVGMMGILLVVIALDVLEMSSGGPGVLNSALGIGGVVGAALSLLLLGRRRMSLVLLVAALVAGVPVVVLGLAGSAGVAMLLVALCGGGKQFFDVAARTLAQRLLPDRLLTGLFGIQESLMMAGLALGSLAAPVLVDQLGVRAALAVAGVVPASVALLAYVALRRLEARTVVPERVLTTLLRIPVLAVLAPRVVERLALEARPRVVGPGTDLTVEGETGSTVYVVERGEVVVRHGETEVRRLGAGTWFGEVAVLRDVPRTATVTTVTETEVYELHRDAFLTSVGVAHSSVRLLDDHARDNYV